MGGQLNARQLCIWLKCFSVQNIKLAVYAHVLALMYAYVGACNACMRVWLYACLFECVWFVYVHIYICMHVSIYIYVCACVCVCVCVCVCACVRAGMNAFTHVCMFVFVRDAM